MGWIRQTTNPHGLRLQGGAPRAVAATGRHPEPAGRAATLIFAASFASSLLGSQALADGLGAWDWVALGLLLAIGGLAVLLLWPYYNLTFRFDPEDLLARDVDVDESPPMETIHKELALQIKADWKGNGRIVRRLRETLQLGLILLLLEIVAWFVSIAEAGGT